MTPQEGLNRVVKETHREKTMRDKDLWWPLYLLAIIYRVLRGPSETTTVLTAEKYHERCYRRICNEAGSVKDTPKLLIWSRRQEHVVKFKRWYMPDRTYVTYVVDIRIASPGGKIQHLPRKYYPAMAWGVSEKDRYPHTVAVNAALHDIFETIKEFDDCKWIALDKNKTVVRENHS